MNAGNADVRVRTVCCITRGPTEEFALIADEDVRAPSQCESTFVDELRELLNAVGIEFGREVSMVRSGTPPSLSEKGVSLCLCENLCVSVVKLLKKTLTTEAQRSHRGTEINFSDRLLRGAGHNGLFRWSSRTPTTGYFLTTLRLALW